MIFKKLFSDILNEEEKRKPNKNQGKTSKENFKEKLVETKFTQILHNITKLL